MLLPQPINNISMCHLSRFCVASFLLFSFSANTHAEILQYIPEFDATLRDDGFDGTFDSGGNANPFNSINRIDGVVNEVLFFEFDLSSLAAAPNLASATLSVDVFGTPNDPGDIEIMAYQADGVLTFPDDGSRPAQFIGRYDPISLGGGMIDIDLDAAVIESMLSSGNFIGFRMQGAETQADTLIRGVAGTIISGISPTLSLEVSAVPEPSAASCLALIGMAVVLRRRRIE